MKAIDVLYKKINCKISLEKCRENGIFAYSSFTIDGKMIVVI